jgi:heptosyltransferase II
MNILVVRFSSMGDVVCATPVFSFLKKKYPKASITFVTDNAYSGLFADDPRLSQVMGIDKGNIENVPVVSTGVWDLAVDLQNNARSRALLAGTRCLAMVGSFDKLHFQRAVLLALRLSFYPNGQNVVTRYIRAAGGLAALRDLEPPALFFSEESKKRARSILSRKSDGTKRPFLAIFPFSAWKNKAWPLENYAATGRHFLATGWDVVIMGGPSDRAPAHELRDRIGGRCISLAGSLSLYECGPFLSCCSLALGNDTGLSHLARACGVKTGVLFGPTTRHFGFYPYGEPPFKIFEVPLVCRPCHAHGGNRCLRVSRACMKRITVESVIRGMEELCLAKTES